MVVAKLSCPQNKRGCNLAALIGDPMRYIHDGDNNSDNDN